MNGASRAPATASGDKGKAASLTRTGAEKALNMILFTEYYISLKSKI